jgi:hypothetical protein
VGTRRQTLHTPRPASHPAPQQIAANILIMSAAALGGKPAGLHCDAPSDVEAVAAFDGMGLKQNLQRAIFEIGFERPTAIQQRAIRPIVSGRNVIAQTESRSGKSAMLSICAMQAVDTLCGDLQVIYLHTGRGQQDDTFAQVAQLLQSKLNKTDDTAKNQRTTSAPCAHMRLHRCRGSELTEHDVQCLSAGAHIACGAPAVADLIRSGHVRTHGVRLLLLDEVHPCVAVTHIASCHLSSFLTRLAGRPSAQRPRSLPQLQRRSQRHSPQPANHHAILPHLHPHHARHCSHGQQLCRPASPHPGQAPVFLGGSVSSKCILGTPRLCFALLCFLNPCPVQFFCNFCDATFKSAVLIDMYACL